MGTTDERQSGAASTNLSEIMMAVAASADRVLIIHGRKERRVLDRCATCLYSDVAPGTTAAGRRQPLFLSLVPALSGCILVHLREGGHAVKDIK